jgi:hypothetical protein
MLILWKTPNTFSREGCTAQALCAQNMRKILSESAFSQVQKRLKGQTFASCIRKISQKSCKSFMLLSASFQRLYVVAVSDIMCSAQSHVLEVSHKSHKSQSCQSYPRSCAPDWLTDIR